MKEDNTLSLKEVYKLGWSDGYEQGRKELYEQILKLLGKNKEESNEHS